MKFSTQALNNAQFPRALERVLAMERAGLDMVWVPEAYGLDAPTHLGYLAAKTERVQLGTGIISVFSRAPTLIAQTAAALDRLSGGRAILGLGASGPQVVEGWCGVPYADTLSRIEETIDIVRQVWRRERVVHHGRVFDIPLQATAGRGLGKALKLHVEPVRSRVPIYVGALGPKSVEMAAAKADGWLPVLFAPEKADAVWGNALAAGKARRPDDLGPLEIVAGGAVAIGDNVAHLRDRLRPALAFMIGGLGAREKNFYKDLVGRYGFEKQADLVQDHYLAGRKKEAEAAVPEQLIEATTLIGPTGYVRERLAAYREAGVTVLDIAPFGPQPERVVEQLRELAG
jgi:F420-dependent oxidoreductase-like protein